jgi:PRC-barrel domain
MLWDISTIRNYEIEAADGGIGTLSDLLCDDATWAIRWLTVDTGNFLGGRKVLLPPTAVKSLDRALGKVFVKLTRTEIENSPPVASDQPVSRQMEARMYVHYGWDPYWDNSLHGTGDHNLDNGDSHLRSLDVMRGYQIHATDGMIGQATDFLLNDEDWSIRYIVVDTGNWWPGRKVLIAPRSVSSIAWADREIRLSVSQDKVKSAPAYSPEMTVDGKYEEKFLTYYGIRWLEG